MFGSMKGRSAAGTPAVYWSLVKAGVKALSRKTARSEALSLLFHVAMMGSQKGWPKPSSYAFPFCVIIAVMEAGFLSARRRAMGAP